MQTKTFDVYISGREKPVTISADKAFAGTTLTFSVGDEVVAEFANGSWLGYRVSPQSAERPTAKELSRS